jgi:hypothetical protein
MCTVFNLAMNKMLVLMSDEMVSALEAKRKTPQAGIHPLSRESHTRRMLQDEGDKMGSARPASFSSCQRGIPSSATAQEREAR